MTSSPVNVGDLRALIRSASANQVETAFAAATQKYAPTAWLSATNIAVAQSPKALPRRQVDHPYSGQTLTDAIEYGAVAAMFHCGDAWSYFSRGIDAFAAGNLEIAQHLLYYSELRAARSILHRYGISIFESNSFVVTSSGLTKSLNSALGDSTATHRATWVVFDEWATVYAPSFLESNIRFLGRSYGDWRDAAPKSTNMDAAASALLKSWGVDLQLFAGDREMRNQLTYEPNRFLMSPPGHSPATVGRSILDAWHLFEPAGANLFENFDGHLIREIFGQHFASRQSSGQFDNQLYRSEMEATLSTLLGEPNSAVVELFCQDGSTPHSLLDSASIDPRDSTTTLADRLVGMLGRASVMLRLATGAVEDLRTGSGTAAADVHPWAIDLLTNRGLSVPTSDPIDFVDMWEELSFDLEGIEGLLDLEDLAGMVLISTVASELRSATAFERVAAWAVA